MRSAGWRAHEDTDGLLQVADGGGDPPGFQSGAQAAQPTESQLDLDAAFATHQFVPFVGHDALQVGKVASSLFLSQEDMQAFGGGDQDVGWCFSLPVPFRGEGISGADGNVPIDAQSGGGPLGRILDLPGESPQGGDPQEVGSPAFFRFGQISRLQDGGDDQRIGLSTSGGGIDQATFTVQPCLPGFQLKGKWKPPLILKPGDGVGDAGVGSVIW